MVKTQDVDLEKEGMEMVRVNGRQRCLQLNRKNIYVYQMLKYLLINETIKRVMMQRMHEGCGTAKVFELCN